MHVSRLSQQHFFVPERLMAVHRTIHIARQVIVSYVAVLNATCDVQRTVAIYSFHRIDFSPPPYTVHTHTGAHRRQSTNTFSFIVRMTEIRGSCLDTIVHL